MIYVVFFSNAGVPAPGLSPTIGVYKKVSDATDVTPVPSVSEVGGGFYKFTASPAENLVVRLDSGGSLADADKYKVMQITPHDADLDTTVSSRGSQADLTAVKAKTDNLPADPASNTQVNTRLAATSYTIPDNTGIGAIKAKTDNLPAAPASEGNVQGHVADALAAYDPPTKAELDAAVAPLAREAGLEAHGLAVLNSYDPPTKTEMVNALANLGSLGGISVAEILSGDLSDSLSFPANSLADLVRKLFWVVCNRMSIEDATMDFTVYKTDGVTRAATGTITDNGATTARGEPSWL